MLVLFTPTPLAAKLAIIIDDIGYTHKNGMRAAKLRGAYTLSILPFTPHAQKLAELGLKHNKELMLHNPMSNTKDLSLGPGALTSGMTRTDFLQTLRRNIAYIPEIQGVNNHMGSQLTQESEPMGWLMDELNRQQLYFIDSRTSTASIAWSLAKLYQLPTAKRNIFLDHSRNKDDILNQLHKAIALASAHGHAIAIGHPYSETLDILESAEVLFMESQVNLVFASELVQTSRTGIEHCPTPPSFLQQGAL